MSQAYTDSFLARTDALLGPEVLDIFSRSCIAIAGLGGVGGAVASTLVRMGFGRFRIADPGEFDLPDLNRQWAATQKTIGRNKAEVYAEFMKDVNPAVKVEVFTKGVTEENAERFLEGADLLVEAMDIIRVMPSVRKCAADIARGKGIYNILPVIIGFSTVVAVSSPGGEPMDRFLAFVEAARSRGRLPARLAQVLNPGVLLTMGASMAKGLIPSISLATGLVASITATQIVMILGGPGVPGRRDPIALPKVIFVDASRMTCEARDIGEFEQEQEAQLPGSLRERMACA